MNGSTDNRASNPSEKSTRPDPGMNLATANRMLPLVRRIVTDILQARRQLACLEPEQERLFRQRHTLAWPERQRRYQLGEEIAEHEQHLQAALAELEVLGVVMLNILDGRIGFPILVNQREAFFAWRPGDEALAHWQFAGEANLRPIPLAWLESADVNVSGKS